MPSSTLRLVPKIIPSQTRRRFDALIRAGHTQAEAARRCEVSLSWAKKRIKELKVRGEERGHDDVAPKLLRMHRQGRDAGEIAEMTGLKKWRVDNVLKHGVAAAPEDEDKVGPIPYEELGPIPKDCWHDFERFRARYLGSVSTPWQTEAAMRVVKMLESPDKSYAVFNEPQGSGKTRLMHDLSAWVTVRDRAIRSITGSLAQGISFNACGNLRDTFERTVPAIARDVDKAKGLAIDAVATLAEDYGFFRPVTAGGVWRRDQFIVAQHQGASMEKEPTWAAFSREAKFLGWRVDFMVWDDLVNTDMLRNEDRVEDLYRWWDDEAQSRLDPGGLCVLVGQRLRSNDIYRYCLDKRVQVDEFDMAEDAAVRPMYHHIVYKAHYEERCSGNVDDHKLDARPYPEGCMLDPARIKWRDILEKQADGNYEVVYQQRDTDPTNVLVKPIWVEGGTDPKTKTMHEGCWDHERALGQMPALSGHQDSFAIRYVTVDPSPTKWWGILDWLYVLPQDGTEPLAGRRYLINIHRAKMGANEFLDYSRNQDTYVGLIEDWVMASKRWGYPITHLVMEKNAAQRWAMQYEFFRSWASTRGVQVLEHETTSNKSDPTFGVWNTIPAAYRFGRVRLPGDTRSGSRSKVWPLVQEVTTYPDGGTDDLVMSQWFGEYNLQHLVHLRRPVGTIYSDRPSWVKQMEAVGAIR